MTETKQIEYTFQMPLHRKIQLNIKYVFDFLISFFGIIILSPLYLCVMILLEITMPGPVFFKQRRVGKDGKEFYILKFRSMKVDKEAEKTLDFSKDSERLTMFGRFIRRTKIDETAQLFNVITGKMSLIGPRPTVMQQVEKYTDFQRHRLDVRPGMTGLAQVNGNTALSWDERIIYDVQYVQNYSFWLDIKILCKTVLIVLFGEEKFCNKPLSSPNNTVEDTTESVVLK